MRLTNAHDYQQLETIYGSHLDSTSTVQPFRAAAKRVAEGRSDTIASSTIVERFAGGFRKITFIHWALR